METKTHWKKTMDKDWIGTYVLPEGRPINVKLLRVEYKEVKVKGVKDWYKIAYFEKNEYFDQPMLLSAAKNLSRLSNLVGSPYIEDWKDLNITVTLQQEMDKAFGGGKDWALRIAEKTVVKKLKPLTEDKFNDAVKFLVDGKTIENLKSYYSFDVIMEQRLKEGVENDGV